MQDDELYYFNGIDGVTGRYSAAPVTHASLVDSARSDSAAVAVSSNEVYGLPFGVRPEDVTKAGWGIVFAQGADESVRKALEPLIEHRAREVQRDRLKILAYRPGDQLRTWLQRHDVSIGSLRPDKVPYYLLLVGSPAAIPFEFQYALDVQYAVGRLYFDSAEGYRRYAESVVRYETAASVPTAREAVFFGTRHELDPATELSEQHLVGPLAAGIPAHDDLDEELPITAEVGFRARRLDRGAATRSALLDVLRPPAGSRTPSLLFSASHGMGWPAGHARQPAAQGALLCQDWSGFGTIAEQDYLSAADLPTDARVHGMVAFLFACFGAGTSEMDPFLSDRAAPPKRLAEQPFVSALPQRLLSHEAGGALAVIGHVDRAWGFSIRQGRNVSPQVGPFRSFIGQVLAGDPVGYGMTNFNDRYAALSTLLLSDLEDAPGRPRPPDRVIAERFIERNDTRSYVVLGDPAARLRADEIND